MVVPVPDEASTTLANHFMQHVLMKCGMCRLDAFDDGTSFKGSFVAMCQTLSMNRDIMSRSNHQGLLIEHFNRFFN